MSHFHQKDTAFVTIGQVAQAAGVSKTTISRYISGQYDSLADSTRKKIEETIAALNYRPNQLARGLKRGRSNLIGVILADISNPFSTAIMRGVEDVAKLHGYSVVVWNTDNDAQKERDYMLIAQSHHIDGLIINTTGQNNAFLRDLGVQKTPIVLVDRKVPDLNFDTVCIDNRSATETALHYLLEKKYERIALFTEPVEGISSRTERQETFSRMLADNGHPSTSDIYVVDAYHQAHLEKSLLQFLYDSRGQFRTVLAGNGVLLLKLCLTFQKLGIGVPESVSCLGFDDPEWALLVGSGITTIAQPTYQIGVAAMNRIIFRIGQGDGLTSELVELPGELIVRGSTPGKMA
ncbi:MAG: LacI family DNA-binding transcriptional regulator [Bacilli bacterium]